MRWIIKENELSIMFRIPIYIQRNIVPLVG